MKTGGRYHQTREGGSYHTDSPSMEYICLITLACYFVFDPAKIGGTSKFLSAYSIHNQTVYKKIEYLLEQLYNKFHFDKRGEFKENESPTVFRIYF